MIPSELLFDIPTPPTTTNKKRLGQYFTGVRLAKLLAALANAREAKTILDPMAGCGDMLEGSLLEGAKPRILGAIDIDPKAHKACSARIANSNQKNASVLLGSAFDINVLQQLPSLSWDLVITNPPYVRYQSLAEIGDSSGLQIPSATQVREGLFTALDLMPCLDKEDQRLFKKLAKNYSGLADLAVPSWILCAALVKPGGTLAMVVPESWLSRDYALVIQYLLLRWFKIQYIIEDSHAAWFPGSLVKTTLLVAERIPRRESAFTSQNGHFLQVALPSETITTESIVGGVFPNLNNTEERLATILKQCLLEDTPVSKLPVSAERIPLDQIALNVCRASQKLEWLQDFDHCTTGNDYAGYLPPRISAWLGDSSSASFTTLETLGARIGQGLRTGANLFFYAEALQKKIKTEVVIPSEIFRIPSVEVPHTCTRPVLRKQSELPRGLTIEASTLPGRVLAFHNFALPEDIISCQQLFPQHTYTPLRGTVADLLRVAAKTKTTSNKLIPTLSAVAPNARGAEAVNTKILPRFWYMLPAFAQRHSPDIVIPRVNGKSLKAFLNKERQALVDANFSSIWFDKEKSTDRYSILALLNSLWATAILELSASVLGGGALKVEASHLRRIPIPKFSAKQWAKLRNLGLRLVRTGGSQLVRSHIDSLIVESLVGEQNTNKKLRELRSICEIQLAKRSHK